VGRRTIATLGGTVCSKHSTAEGINVTQRGSEFAEEIVEAMDLYRAGRAVPSLGASVGDLRGALKRVASDD